jgi:hypothetical protein
VTGRIDTEQDRIAHRRDDTPGYEHDPSGARPLNDTDLGSKALSCLIFVMAVAGVLGLMVIGSWLRFGP